MAGKRDGAHTTNDTLELKVDNMSFLLEQLGRDCAPDQLVRELTVNAIQAIREADEEGGLVVWDHEPVHTERCGAFKLAISDTGVGMTGPEMVRYINHLASSGRTQSEDGNFGVGAKIAAATRNPAGMVYLSWKDGEGAMIRLWRNPETGRYGLKRLPLEDGGHGYWAPAPEEAKPAHIGEHGTVVVLLGRGERDDTMGPPDEAAGGAEAGGDGGVRGLWLTRYLNARFFRFPEGLEVRARERWGTDASALRRVEGMRSALEAVSDDSGAVDLRDAVARWWVLPEADAIPERMAERHPGGGHVAALFQDELYEVYSGRSGTAKLQSFGIAVGHRRIVLYVEPKTSGPRRVASNTARTALLVDGRPLPWGRWAETFRRDLPRPILDVMEEAAGTRDARDHTRSFKDRMKNLANVLLIGGGDPEEALRRLFAPGRRRRDDDGAAAEPAGRAEAGSSEAADGREGDGAEDGTPDREDGPGHDGAEAADDRDGADAAGDGPSEEPPAGPDLDLDRLLDIHVAWVSESESGAPDRAGHYIAETNTLLMNRDFRLFREYIERWRDKYAGNPVAQREVEDLVREWLEQPLRELVIRSHFLHGADGWSEQDIRALLSDEALTAVSLPCYLTEMRLRRAVSQRLGKLRGTRQAA